MKGAIAMLAAGLVASPAISRDTLGIFEGWGSFRDSNPVHCFAISEPVQETGGAWRPFASITNWPDQSVRGQLHIRLSRERRAGADVMLSVDNKRWRLVAGRFDAWAPTARHDAFIIAKIRSGRSLSVSTVAATGGGFADTYRLKGAATAIDAAALGCARGR